MTRRIAMAGLCALILFGVSACGSKAASSPEEVYAKAKAINENKTWGDMIDIIAPADRENTVFGMLFGAGFLTMANEEAKAEYEALTKKHGLDKLEEESKDVKLSDKAAVEAFAKKVFAGKDLRAIMQDIGDFMAKYSDDFGKEDEFKEMKDLKIDGSNATAMVDGKERKFKQVDGAWYMGVN